MAGSGLRFFFVFDFSLVLMPLNHGIERCKAKAKAKAKATAKTTAKATAKANKKATRTSFLWFRCVSFGVGLSLSLS